MAAESAPTPIAPPARIGLFLALTCLLSWPIWFLSGVLSRAGTGAFDFRWLLAQVGVFGPSLAALVVSGAGTPELRRNSLRLLPFLLLPLLVPGLLIARDAPASVAEFGVLPAVAAVVVATLMILGLLPVLGRLLHPGTGAPLVRPPGRWIFLSVTFFPALFLIAWILANSSGGAREVGALRNGVGGLAWIAVTSFAHNSLLGGPLGEEIGWRGYLLPTLLRRHSPLAASLILGVVWALWHLPIDLYAGFLVQGPGAVLVRILWTLPGTILITWVYLRARGSLLVAVFLHTSIGVLADFDFSRYESTLAVFFVLMAVAAVIVSISSSAFRGRS